MEFVNLIQSCDGEEIDYPLLGESDTETKEGLELEVSLLDQMGLKGIIL